MITAKAITVSMVFSIKVPGDLGESERQRQKETRCALRREEWRIRESERVHMGTLLESHLYRFEKSLTRPKKSISHVASMLSKPGIIHFASSAEKLYQLQSVPDKAGNQCLIFLNFATPLQPRRKHLAHFQASKPKSSKLRI